MENEVAVVHEDPLGAVVTFNTQWQFTGSFHPQMNLVTYGLILADVGAGTDNEVIGEAGNLEDRG